MRIINVREMRKSATERYSRTIRLLHLVITPYLHFPFRSRTWQRTRGRTRREQEKKRKGRRKQEKIKKRMRKRKKRICIDRKPEECEWKRIRYLRFIIYLDTKKKNLNSFIDDISALYDSSKSFYIARLQLSYARCNKIINYGKFRLVFILSCTVCAT